VDEKARRAGFRVSGLAEESAYILDPEVDGVLQ
jgi:hypothetical protein